MNRIHSLVCILAAYAIASATWAAPDDLDPRFGVEGKRLLGEERTRIRTLFQQPDGRILAQEFLGQLWRVNADGTPDIAFGIPCGSNCYPRGIARDASGRIVVGFHALSGVNYLAGAMRLLPDGLPDWTFGNAALGSVFVPNGSFSAIGVVVHVNGNIVVAGSMQDHITGRRPAGLIRLLSTGVPDPMFGNGGLLVLPVDGQLSDVALDANGKLVIVGRQFELQLPETPEIRTVVARVLPDGRLDPDFADAGVFRDASADAVAPRALALQADGKLLIAGTVRVGDLEQFAVMRLDSIGQRDATFGIDGRVVVTVEAGTESAANAIAVDSRQRIVAAGTLVEPGYPNLTMQRIVAARFDADGSPDEFFGPRGVTTTWEGYGASASAVVIQPGDAILLGGDIELEWPYYIGAGHYARRTRAALLRLKGGEGSVPRTIPEGIAVEYFHAGFGHYFISATPSEIARLDTTDWLGWTRTGKSFKVWSGPASNLSDVCRFFSDQSFAPKSSHFYTPYPDECSGLRSGSTWTFEGSVFRLQLPLGVLGARDCPPGNARLYRLYNNGQGGAPNHRYTDDLTVFEQMLAQGWTFEGEAQTRVFACIPQPS